MNWHPELRRYLQHMAKVKASDVYLTAGVPAVFRIDGIGYSAKAVLEASALEEMATSIMSQAQRDEFALRPELNLALTDPEGERYRANVFRQRGAFGMVVRRVRAEIQSLDDLDHPPVLKEVAMSRRGLVLLVGATGSGKSTTLAAMIDHRNRSETGHIVTIEDPIEFVHPHQSCIVTQREVGVDTLSYADALKNALRQAPDVILIGEIRDVETMEAAIAFAETGHLCVSTLHANNANQALKRILNFFPVERHQEICHQLSLNMRAVISQRLVAARKGGRAAALEILLDTPRIKELIRENEIDVLKDAMEQAHGEGCRTFDSSLFDLVVAERISSREALRAADSPNNLRLRLDRHRRRGGQGEEEPALRLLRPKRAETARDRLAAGTGARGGAGAAPASG